jgi:nicotinate phosphoribosyltransferase
MSLTTSPLVTDLYQLSMLNAYFASGMRDIAVFELFVRRLPPGRNFMMAAGLEQALEFLEDLSFSPDELEWIESSRRFRAGFASDLGGLRFTGDVHAMPEGTLFFADEPVLRVTAPLPEAQLVETRLINLVHLETLIATKAARCVLAAPGKTLVDFGLRRAHGAEAGVLAARAAYIAGFAGTATVFAGKDMGIPLFGTMAHSFVQAHDDERAAFADYLRFYPDGTTLLIDTYDTEGAARKVVALARELGDRAASAIKAVRLDSGDLAALAMSVRRILDEGGLRGTAIFASGNLDEYRLLELVARGAPIDGFGVGTSLVTSADAPTLDAVYKLQEYGGRARRKRSPQKATWPGRKQVYRHYDAHGRFQVDRLALETEAPEGAEALLVPVMKKGRRLGRAESLAAIRERAAAQLGRLPDALKTLHAASTPYRVDVSPGVRELAETLDRGMTETPNRA